jgi:hypothetical protein
MPLTFGVNQMGRAIKYKGFFICPIRWVNSLLDGAEFFVSVEAPAAAQTEKGVQLEIDSPRFETKAEAREYIDAKKRASAVAGILGKVGGRARSQAKTVAARKNGLSGGRPINLRGGRKARSKDSKPRVRRTQAELKAVKRVK